jgi:hypothetical protein
MHASPTASPPRPRSLAAARHRQAWEKALTLRQDRQQSFADVKTNIQGVPVALRTQGLAITLATLVQRSSTADDWIANRIGEWLLRDCPTAILQEDREIDPAYSAAPQLLKLLMETTDVSLLGAVNTEAILFSGALKLIVTALAATQPPSVETGTGGEDHG